MTALEERAREIIDEKLAGSGRLPGALAFGAYTEMETSSLYNLSSGEE